MSGEFSEDLKRALKRPKNYNSRSASDQWRIDKELGILDWNPTVDETREYIKRRRKSEE